MSTFDFHNHFYTVGYGGTGFDLTQPHLDRWHTEFMTTPGTAATGEACAAQRFEIEQYGNHPIADALVQVR